MNCKCNFKAEENLFKIDTDNPCEIDPDNEQDWYSLTLGWALGKGLSIELSHEFATHIRYHTDLG